MKTKYLIIITIVLLSFMVIGLTTFLVMCLNSNFVFLKRFGEKSQNIIFERSYDMSTIENIDISCGLGDIEFKQSDDNRVKVIVYGKYEEDVKDDSSNNEMKIKTMNQKRKFFNFYSNDIIVYIPKEYSNQINVKQEYGDVKILDLEGVKIDINSDCGDVNLGKVKSAKIDSNYGDVKIDYIYESADIKVDCGNLKINSVKNITANISYGDIEIGDLLNKCDIKSSCGDVKIHKIMLNENSKIESELGNVKILEKNDICIDAQTSLGDIKIGTNNFKSEVVLKIENDCGDVKVE